MLNNLPANVRIAMIENRIHILYTRGEIMNQGIIHKLMREKRKLLGDKVRPTLISLTSNIDYVIIV